MIKKDIESGESEVVEFKRELPAKDKKVMKTVVAFANCKGGKVVFGVDDATHEIHGLPDVERARLQDMLTDMISDICVPQIFPSFSWWQVEGKSLFVVEIPKSSQTPYYIKSEGLENGVYVRVGATTRKASLEKVRELQLRGQNVTYDAVVESGASAVPRKEAETLCSLIRGYISDSAVPVGVNQLISWGLLQRNSGTLYPSNAYRILAGINVHFSCIQCAVFQGTEKVNFLDRKEFSGPASEQLENALRFLMQNLRCNAVIENVRREDVYEIPLLALRELIANAILHRNYLVHAFIQISVFDDRVEIISPGGLYDNLTMEEMFSGFSRLRNPLLADVFRRMGIVEQWGTGIQRAVQQCAKAGLPAPEFEISNDAVKITMRRPGREQLREKQPRKRRAHKRDEALLAYLKDNPGAPLQQAADAFFISVATVWRFVQDMRKEGRL